MEKAADILEDVTPTASWNRVVMAYVSVSADGYIARLDGDTTWAKHAGNQGKYGLSEIRRMANIVVVGRKTYESQTASNTALKIRRNERHVVFTRDPSWATGVPRVETTSERPGDFVERLRAKKGKHALLLGGQGLLTSFLDDDALDYLFLRIVPIFIGEGIPLFVPRQRTTQLRLFAARRYSCGVVLVQYRVLRNGRDRHRVAEPTLKQTLAELEF